MSSVTAQHVDVVVVGAGIAGASVAAHLAQSQLRVVLVEMESAPAQHASGRSASVLSETSGHPSVCALARLSRPFFESPPEGFADHDLLSPRGLMWVGQLGDEPALDRLALDGARVRSSVRRVDAEQVARHLPTFSAAAIAGGGVVEPDAMAIDTASVIDGYLRMLRAFSGVVHTTAEVIRCEQMGERWRVTAGDHVVEANAVVNAAGAWADEVATRAGLTPIGTVALRRTAAIAATDADISAWPLVMDIASRYYCEPEPGGLLISPGDETPSEPCDARPDETDVALALERVRDATGLPLRSIRSAWAGLRTFAPDRVPVLGEDPSAPCFWWCAGQGGAGIKTSPAMGDLLARSMTARPWPVDATELGLTPDQLSPARFR